MDDYNVGLEKTKVTKLCRDLVEELMEKEWPVELMETDRVMGGDTREKNKFQGEVGSEVVVGLDAVG